MRKHFLFRNKKGSKFKECQKNFRSRSYPRNILKSSRIDVPFSYKSQRGVSSRTAATRQPHYPQRQFTNLHEPTLSFATEKILSSSSDQAEWAKVNLTIVKTQHDQLARISKASLNLSKIWKNQGFQLSIGQHNCDLPSQHRDSNLRFVCFTKCCCIIHFI